VEERPLDARRSTLDAPIVVRPDGWPRPHGYADGVIAEGRLLSISGQIGWDPATMQFASDDFAEQTAQALRNVVAVLRAGGAGPEHLVRLTWYVTDRAAYVAARRAIGAAYRAIIGAHYPAMSVVVVAGLLEPRALVEIEATAVVPA
jgi:enamine deaminase RidA (YjgF/YER057c/UK114 family)